jgi:hypothetical protein
MKKFYSGILALLFLAFFQLAYAQNNKVIERIFLVGDAGKLDNGKHPVCDWLKSNIDWNDTTNVLLYLGDNIYPQGMPVEGDKNYEEAKKVLDYQISVVKDKKAKAYFLPGNHDWKRGKVGGLEQIKNQGDYVKSLELNNVQLLPEDGCAGPMDVVISDQTVVLFIDSNWWLHKSENPGIESDCPYKTEEEISFAIKNTIASYPDKLIILAMHHPLNTTGIHGGYYTFKQHLFPLTDLKPNLFIPLPVIGSIYPLSRKWFGNVEDIKHPFYKDYVETIKSAINGHPNVVQVAGHEHSLELMKTDGLFNIVSGSGAKSTRIKMGKNSLFASEKKGFAVIEVMADKTTRVKFYSSESSDLTNSIFEADLFSIPEKIISKQFDPVNFPDSVTVVASSKFKSGGLRKFLLGENYRKEWETPIKVKVLNMATEFGGLIPLKLGGGHQTKSLRLADKEGNEYVLRQVEKNVTDAAMPPDLRGVGFANDLIADGVSASYPYAALSVPPFAEVAGIPHTNPTLVFVPADPLLGKFINDFSNSFCLFEQRNPTDNDKTWNTEKMKSKLLDDNDNIVDQKATLQARLVDMFIMDFDRHEDQWRWGATDNGKGKTYFPVPRDRDQPFFISRGILPYFASRPEVAPQLQGFRPKARHIRSFNFNARNFDRNFMNELDREDWRKAADSLLNLMTDDLIEEALGLQPAEIQPYSVKSIVETLKERRQYYVDEMLTYYTFLAKIVTVYGSNKKEYFDVERHDDGAVTVKVFKINKSDEIDTKIYERKFLSSETKEIRLYGLKGSDKFNFYGSKKGKIKIRVIGGTGKDEFESDVSGSKILVYDLSTEKNTFSEEGNFKKKLSENPDVNAFNFREYKYNVYAPFISAAYNPDDGLYLGVALKYTSHSFRKTPFAIQQTLSASHSLATKAYRFSYGLEALSVFNNTDFLLKTVLNAPNNTINFFTFGNETVYDRGRPEEIEYYRARFTLADVQLLLRRKISSSFSLAAGPAFQFYSYDSSENTGRLISQFDINGLDVATLAKTKTYGGFNSLASLDNRNNKTLPSRGVNWQTSFTAYQGLGEFSNNYSLLRSDLSFYASFNKKARVVIANRFGGGVSFGDIEFYQAQNLSGTDNLRSYRRYRFSGTKMFYHNLDLRIKLAEFRTYVFPGSLGLLLFNDVGRVWVDGENSEKWHQSYGGGIWFAPLSRFVINAFYGVGDDGGLPGVSFGFQF